MKKNVKLTKAQRARKERLLPKGKPRYVRLYDMGESQIDRYTIVYTGHYDTGPRKSYMFRGASTYPVHPMGVGMMGESSKGPIDRPAYSHLGKPIKFEQLPEDVKKLALSDYKAIWGL